MKAPGALEFEEAEMSFEKSCIHPFWAVETGNPDLEGQPHANAGKSPFFLCPARDLGRGTNWGSLFYFTWATRGKKIDLKRSHNNSRTPRACRQIACDPEQRFNRCLNNNHSHHFTTPEPQPPHYDIGHVAIRRDVFSCLDLALEHFSQCSRKYRFLCLGPHCFRPRTLLKNEYAFGASVSGSGEGDFRCHDRPKAEQSPRLPP